MDSPLVGFVVIALVVAGAILLFVLILLAGRRGTRQSAPAAADPTVRRVLVVLTTDCVDERVCDRILAQHDSVEVRVAVPEISGRLGYYVASDDRDASRVARDRLEHALGLLAAKGVTASGSVGDGSASAAQLIADHVGDFAPSEIIVVVHPEPEEHWSEQHLVQDAAQRFDVPVTIVHAFDATAPG